MAIFFGLLTLVGLLAPLPPLTEILLNWAAMIAAIALLLGVMNLFVVHARRFGGQRNGYSGVLIMAMLAVFALAVTDSLGVTVGGVDRAFHLVQVPLETAVASLMAFFLLTAGFQLLKRQRSGWSVLFLLSAMFLLLIQVLLASSAAPPALVGLAQQAQRVLQEVIVTAGMRGILLGVALGTITLSVRLLIGMERPYNK